jgi:hypothetical protein
MDRFSAIGDRIVDGNPVSIGRDVTKAGSRDLSREARSVTGYCIVNADSLDDAEKLVRHVSLL